MTHDKQEFGFERTVCACRKCQLWFEHQPGYLVPSDLTRLIPPDVDPFVWAEEHLRASRGHIVFSTASGTVMSIPSLVPQKGTLGTAIGTSKVAASSMTAHRTDAPTSINT